MLASSSCAYSAFDPSGTMDGGLSANLRAGKGRQYVSDWYFPWMTMVRQARHAYDASPWGVRAGKWADIEVAPIMVELNGS